MSEQNLINLAEDFALFEDWEDRYRYLIDLGKQVPVMENSLKTEENKVRGCTSQVWMVAEWRDGRLYFQADSDAQIVRGLIHILSLAYQGLDKGQIEAVDLNKTFAELGLDRHLSPSRRNGFFSMVQRIKAMAYPESA